MSAEHDGHTVAVGPVTVERGEWVVTRRGTLALKVSRGEWSTGTDNETDRTRFGEPSPWHETMGQRMRRLRHQLGMTLADVSEATSGGISTSYLNDLEHDRREPSVKMLRLVGRALGVRWCYLMPDSMREP